MKSMWPENKIDKSASREVLRNRVTMSDPWLEPASQLQSITHPGSSLLPATGVTPDTGGKSTMHAADSSPLSSLTPYGGCESQAPAQITVSEPARPSLDGAGADTRIASSFQVWSAEAINEAENTLRKVDALRGKQSRTLRNLKRAKKQLEDELKHGGL